MLRCLLALLGCLALLPTAAQNLCAYPTIKQLYNGDQGYAVADAQGQLLIPYAQRPLVVLTPALVKVALQYGHAKWGVLDLRNQLRLPIEYEENDLDNAGCGYLCARLPGSTSLYDPAGKLVYRRGGCYTFRAYPRWNVLVEVSRPPGFQSTTGHPDTLRLLDLATHRQLALQTPASGGNPLYVDGGDRRTRPAQELPFFAVSVGRGPSGVRDIVRLLDTRGRVRYDSLDGAPYIDGRGTVFIRHLRRPLVITDTLLREVPWLSHRYDDATHAGPGGRYWAVSHQDLSGVLDGQGRVVLPVQYFGRLDYAGRGCWLLTSRQAATHYLTTYELLTRDHRLLDLSEYYLEGPRDTTLAAQPILLKNQKTGKYGLLNPEGGWVLPPRLDRLEALGDGMAFFQGDSTGYLDRRGRLRLLVPQCQELSAYFEGMAACGKLVPNASRQQFPSAQIRYSTERGPEALQYAFLDSTGRLATGYFDWVGAFRGGYARVIKNSETYMIDRRGRRAELPGGLQLASYFGSSGLAVVRQGQHEGLADRTGRVVLPVRYQHIATESSFPKPNFLASRDNSRNHLQEFFFPKLTGGQVTVTTDDGQQAQVPVPPQ